MYENDLGVHQAIHPEVAESLIDNLVVWLNKNKPVKKDHRITKDDICYISLNHEEMRCWPGVAEYDPWLRCRKKTFYGIELRETYTGEQQITGKTADESNRALSRRLAWKITGNTTAMFN